MQLALVICNIITAVLALILIFPGPEKQAVEDASPFAQPQTSATEDTDKESFD